jgi:hypothetical protein
MRTVNALHLDLEGEHNLRGLQLGGQRTVPNLQRADATNELLLRDGAFGAGVAEEIRQDAADNDDEFSLCLEELRVVHWLHVWLLRIVDVELAVPVGILLGVWEGGLRQVGNYGGAKQMEALKTLV